ncbi:MAG: 1-acyl-sn-glycerol-3-phosphate acyltransferase [Bacteroidales bacterium]|nr:1-acyl-sn-glycerol-3-phosphate acyltransferase [Bacteroidales bacterium]
MDKFENIRPYGDDEVSQAVERIVKKPCFAEISSYLFPNEPVSYFRNIMLECRTVDDFQGKVMKVIVDKILANTAKKLSFKGIENVADGRKHLFLSNHRDIVLDSAILQVILFENDIQTSEIAVGDNLVSSSFIEDIIRLNKMIKVHRSSSPRELYESSQLLSEFIRDSIKSGKSSIWIAQRNGRTKDGNDITEQGLLKMLDMSGSGDFYRDFEELSLVPMSISYEFESCDILKTMENYISRRRKYVKDKNEDLNSIIYGMMQYKGNIHVELDEPVPLEYLREASNLEKNERFKDLASFLDKRIINSFKLWPNNYIAYDLLEGMSSHADKYTVGEKASFTEYVNVKLSALEGDSEELRDIFLGIYANPVKRKESEKIGM